VTFLGFPAASRFPRLSQYRFPARGRLLVGPALAGRVSCPRPFLFQAVPAIAAGPSLEDLLGLVRNVGRLPLSVKPFFLERYPN